jgi:hypothetical protein
MVQSDRPEDETPPPAPKRKRRKPPVLELQATEVGAGQKASEKSRTSASEKPKAESGAATSAGSGSWHSWRPAGSGGASLALGAGAAGAVAGALLVYFLAAPAAQPVPDPRVRELTDQVAGLSAKIESLAARPAIAPPPDQSRLVDRIEKLAAVLGDAEQRLAAIEKRPLPQTPDLSGVNERAAAIESALKELRGALADLRRAAEATPAAATPAAVENVAKRIGGLEERIASLAAVRAAAPAQANALAAEIVALNSLAAAVESGRPFAGELAAARARLGDRGSTLAGLEPLAVKGVPTAAVLAERFSRVTPDLLRAPSTDDGVLSRLMSNATRLVEVRRVGEPGGTSAGAVVARIETKLARGDITGAIAEADILPDPAKAAAAEWLSLARQQNDATLLVQKQIDLTLAGNAEKAKP